MEQETVPEVAPETTPAPPVQPSTPAAPPETPPVPPAAVPEAAPPGVPPVAPAETPPPEQAQEQGRQAPPPPPAAPPGAGWRPNFAPGSIQHRITERFSREGLNPAYVLAIVGQESGFDPNIRNRDSGAYGLFQFIPSTARAVGLRPNGDVDEQIEAGVRFIKRNTEVARRVLGREPTAGELYVLHYQGEGAGSAILSNPAGSFRATLGSRYEAVIRANPWLGRIETNQDFINFATGKINRQLTRLGQAPEGGGTPIPTRGTGPNAIGLSDVQAPPPISFEDENRARRQAQLAEEWGTGRMAWEALSRESALSYLSNEEQRFVGDPNFRMTPEMRRELTRGLPEDYWSYIDRARSPEHAKFLRERVEEEINYERQLAARGGWGAAMRIGAAILDPAGWALVAATGPLVGGSAKLGRIGRAGILAVEGAGANLLLSTPQYLNRPGQDIDDLIMAGAFGAAFGGIFGAALKPRIADDLAEATARAARNLEGTIGTEGVGAAAVSNRQALRQDSADAMTPEVAAEIRRPGLQAARSWLAPLNMEDFASALSRSDNELVAMAGNRLVEDAVGAADRQMTTFFSVSEKQRKLYLQADTDFMTEYRSAYQEWAKTNNLSWWDSLWRQGEFNELTARYVRDTNPLTTPDPSVARASQAFRAMTERYAKLAADPGLLDGNPGLYNAVRGFEDGNIKPDPNYMPRFVHWEKLNTALEKFGDQNIVRAVSAAIREAQPTIERKLAKRLAQTWLKTHREVKAGMNSSVGDGLSGRNMHALRELLINEGYDKGSIEKVVNLLRAPKDSDAGAYPRARFRLLMKENYEHRMPNGEVFRIDDLFDNDLVRVARMYNRQMSGQVSMSTLQIRNPRFNPATADVDDVPEFLVDGMSSRSDWDNFIQQVKGVYDEKGTPGPIRDRELRQLQRVYDLIVGNPHELETREIGFFIRTLQKFNFARVMNQVGFAQVAEFGNILGQAGVRATSQAMPIWNRMVLDAATGQMDKKLARELVYITSAGTDWVRSFANATDEFGAMNNITGYSPLARGVDETLDKAGRVTSAISLMAPINYGLQRIAAGAAVAKFANMAGDSASLQTARLRALGLDDAMTQRILAEIKAKAGRVRLGEDISGANINALNLEQWDPQVRVAFENAVWRWSRRMIQENDIGQMSLITSNPIGKLFFQFRSFMLAAYTKQTLHSIHMRDWSSFTSFMFSMVFGGLAYTAQTYLQSIGRSDADKFLTEKLGDDDKGSAEQKLAAAAFQRAGAASLFPFLFDNVIALGGYDPVFGSRTSGLPSQGLVSNPTLSLTDNVLMATKSLFTGEFSQQDARRMSSLLLFQNFLPFQWILNSFIQDLPEKDRPSR